MKFTIERYHSVIDIHGGEVIDSDEVTGILLGDDGLAIDPGWAQDPDWYTKHPVTNKPPDYVIYAQGEIWLELYHHNDDWWVIESRRKSA